jgi:hypothetical protein
MIETAEQHPEFKISRSFDRFLAKREREATRNAIVIYRPEKGEGPSSEGRALSSEDRRKLVSDRASLQASVQARIGDCNLCVPTPYADGVTGWRFMAEEGGRGQNVAL